MERGARANSTANGKARIVKPRSMGRRKVFPLISPSTSVMFIQPALHMICKSSHGIAHKWIWRWEKIVGGGLVVDL